MWFNHAIVMIFTQIVENVYVQEFQLVGFHSNSWRASVQCPAYFFFSLIWQIWSATVLLTLARNVIMREFCACDTENGIWLDHHTTV